MQGLLSPKVDFIFKKIFGNEQHPEVLVSFLNAVLEPEDLIVSVVINNTDLEKESPSDKMSRLDIRATTNNGVIINIEMQMKNEYNMNARTLFYWARMFSGQLNEKQNYETLKQTICINILNYNHLKEEDYHNVYTLTNNKSQNQLTDLIELHFIELPKFKKISNKENQKLLEKWLNFINEPQVYIEEKPEETEIETAVDCLTKISASDRERAMYDKRLEAIWEYNNFVSTKKQIEEDMERMLKEGLAKSKAEGMAQGKAEGMAEGTAKGKAEGKAKSKAEGFKESQLKIAKGLLDILDNETIALKTGLSIEEVEKLRN